MVAAYQTVHLTSLLHIFTQFSDYCNYHLIRKPHTSKRDIKGLQEVNSRPYRAIQSLVSTSQTTPLEFCLTSGQDGFDTNFNKNFTRSRKDSPLIFVTGEVQSIWSTALMNSSERAPCGENRCISCTLPSARLTRDGDSQYYLWCQVLEGSIGGGI